jgi:hypothetical protein
MRRWICFFTFLLFFHQAATAGTSNAAGDPIYGPEKFVCGRWIYPDVHMREFAAAAPGSGLLTVRNGGGYGLSRVAVAEIFLNGGKIFGIEDFLRTSPDLEAAVTLAPRNTLTVKLYSYPGSYLTLSVAGKDPAAVEILEPPDGAAVPADRTAVTGRVSGLAPPFGVSVNGVPALVREDRFAVTGIPLREGSNTLAAVATEGDGRTVAAECVVHASPRGEGIALAATVEAGISPFETTLAIEAPFSFDAATLSHEGPGKVDILESRPGKFRIRITGAGLYAFSVEVMKDDRSFHDTLYLLSMDREDIDGMLRKTWDDMKSALIDGDLAAALNHFHEDTRELYGEIFDALGDDLPRITGEMKDIEFVSMENNLVRYRIRKEQTYGGKPLTTTHDVYFARSGSGLWKIYRY